MDNDPVAKLQNGIINLSNQLLRLADQVAHIEAAMTVLKIHAILMLSPDDPLAGAKQFRELEEKLIAADPEDQARKKALDLSEACSSG